MEKVIAVVNGDNVSDVAVKPGTTASDLLSELGLAGHWLSPRDGAPFGADEDVYGRIEQGQKLFASPEASVAV